MADIRPFRSVRYNTEKVGELERVVTQPYDKISPEMQARYYDLSPYNLVRIIRGRQNPADSPEDNVYTRAARHVHALFIEVNELTDRTENALKFIGDIYAARLFGLVADRLGLGMRKAAVEAKLKTLDDIYRFAVEQSSMSRGQLLELIVVVILVLELLPLVMGVLK